VRRQSLSPFLLFVCSGPGASALLGRLGGAGARTSGQSPRPGLAGQRQPGLR